MQTEISKMSTADLYKIIERTVEKKLIEFFEDYDCDFKMKNFAKKRYSALFNSINVEANDITLKESAELMLDEYVNNPEMTALNSLDSEDFYETR